MRTKATKKERLPVNGVNRNILSIKDHDIPLCDCQSKGHKRCVDETHLHECWVNDYNVERFKDAGYEFWTHDVAVGDKKLTSSTMTSSVVSKNTGNGLVSYLMVTPQQWYEEDMAKMAQQVTEKEDIMKRQFKEGEGRYGEVKIQSGGKTDTIKV